MSALRRFREGTSSNSSSRAASATRTPIPDLDSDDDFLDQDISRIDELSQKLLSLQQTVEQDVDKSVDKTAHRDRKQHDTLSLNRLRIKNSNSIPEIINSLELPRTEVSTSSRELLLAQLYKLIVQKPLIVTNEENYGTELYIDEDKVQRLINVFTNRDYRTDTELLYLFRSIIALIASNIEDFGTFISVDFLKLLETLITEPATSVVTNNNKANLVTGYTSITLILHHNASSFGIDDKILWLIDLAEGFSQSASVLKDQLSSGDREHATFITDKNMDSSLINDAKQKIDDESLVSVNVIQGIGSLLTLLPKGDFLNDLCQDLMLKLVSLLDDEIKEISKASARTIAIIYEIYEFENDSSDNDDEDDEYNSNSPYYEQEYLLSIFERLTNLSTKKVSKKEKKDIHSIFRSVGNTLKLYIDQKSRQGISNRTEEGLELMSTYMNLTNIKLSKYKVLPINSWQLYSKLKQLKWVFSFGLHSQLVCNESIKDILDDEEEIGNQSISYRSVDPADLDSAGDAFDKKNSINEKKRASKIKKERISKLSDRMGDLEV